MIFGSKQCRIRLPVALRQVAHGVDVAPDGKWIVGSGKLQGVTTVFNFEKIQTAIRNRDFTGDEDGIPILKYESVKDAEVEVGLGPLHTQFGTDGFAYTSLFVDSAITKWKLGTWEVVDKVPMSYSIGHLAAAEGDTVSPDGNYLVGLNKLSHGRHLNVGPSQPESSQLVDITEEKMKLLLDAVHGAGASLRARSSRQTRSRRSKCIRRRRTSIRSRTGTSTMPA